MSRCSSHNDASEARLVRYHYSGGLHVKLKIAYDAMQFRLRVRDNGHGIVPEVLQQVDA